METIKITRERIQTSCLNHNMTDEDRLRWCRHGAIEHNDANILDSGWAIRDIRIVSVKPDPRNDKRPPHNQMDIVKALVTEANTEVL